MNKKLLLALSCALTLMSVPTRVLADDELSQTESSLNDDVKKPNFEAAIKEKYSLSDDQLKVMHDKGMNDQQITIAAQLSKDSGKTIEEVTKMRTEDKMGWGKIAKQLGVPPKQIGQGVASMHHELNEEKDEKRDDKKEAREDKQEERHRKRDEKRDAREQKHAEQAQKKGKG